MPKANLKQADLQRIIRAAEKAGLAVEIDLKTMMVSFVPLEKVQSSKEPSGLAPDGKENWDD